jgi:thiamine-phosphate diphosphorylase
VEPLVAVAGGAPVLVNDRVDVALAAHAGGVQLGRFSIPVAAARRILGGEARIGYSAHAADEAEAAAREGADFVVVGTIYATPSHPGEPGAGPERIREVAPRVSVPVIAIGGMAPQRVPEVLAAGAHGIAVLGGVWNDTDPVTAIHRYLAALEGRA